MNTRFTLLRTGFAVLMLKVAASAATYTLSSSEINEDALVSAANPSSNYGGAGALGVAASTLSKGEFDSLIQFNLGGAKTSFDTTFGPGQWVINSITLQFTATAPNNPFFNGYQSGPSNTNVNAAGSVAIEWMQNDSWTEGSGSPNSPGTTGITYSSLSSFTSSGVESVGSYSFGGGTSGNTTWNLGLTTSFVADATAGNAVSLLMLPGDSNVSMLVNSRTGASKPVLTISAVAAPEPDAFALLAGSAGMWLARRRRHARPE